MRFAFAVIVLLSLAPGCPRPGGSGAGGGQGGAIVRGPGCPSAANVHVASYVSPDEGGTGHAGWVLPLFDRVVNSLTNVGEYTNIDPQAAAAAGVPAAPANLWLLGAKPCKATVGKYYAARVEAPTPNITYGVELDGCAAPQDPHNASAIVVVSSEAPAGCQVIAPRGIAQRLGESDDKGVWKRPTKETPIPPAIAAVVPRKDCTPPGCEPLWSVAQIDVAGKPIAWAAAANWLTIPPNATADSQCTWKAERFSGFFVAGPDGSPSRVTDGQDHPLALTAALLDAGGVKALVAEGPGEYSTYDVADGKATLARHLVWLRPHPDSYEAVDHLGPLCGD